MATFQELCSQGYQFYHAADVCHQLDVPGGTRMLTLLTGNTNNTHRVDHDDFVELGFQQNKYNYHIHTFSHRKFEFKYDAQ